MSASERPLTLAEPCEYEIDKIKGSRFIGFACPITGPDGVSEKVEARRRAHAKARHHCWAFAGAHALERGSSDAGEPRGSAGVPIAKVLEGRGLVQVLVVVTRYFGGTKLGVGGLVRAYGQAAKAVLDVAPTIDFVLRRRFAMDVAFDDLGAVYGRLQRYGVEARSRPELTGMHVEFELECPSVAGSGRARGLLDELSEFTTVADAHPAKPKGPG